MSDTTTEVLTVTENHTSTMPSDNSITFDIGVLKTRKGLFKLFETVIAIAVIALLAVRTRSIEYSDEANLASFVFFMCVVSSGYRSCTLLLSYVMSPQSADALPKTNFEFLHNVIALLLCAPSSIALIFLFGMAHHEDPKFHVEIFITVLGLVISVLYGLGTFYSFKSFRTS